MPNLDITAANVPRPAPFVSLEICDGWNTRSTTVLVIYRSAVESEI